MRIALLAAVLPLVLAAGCAPGAGGSAHSSPFKKMLSSEHKKLAAIVEYDAFIEACERNLLLDHEGFVAQHGITVRGSGSAKYINGYELLNACGPDCTPAHGLGQILQEFIVDQSK